MEKQTFLGCLTKEKSNHIDNDAINVYDYLPGLNMNLNFQCFQRYVA
jgi:hypothetical protein